MKKVLVAALVMCALSSCSPHLKTFQDPHKEANNAQTKHNMEVVQLAAETYDKAQGHYPTAIDDAFKSYFVGGGNDGKTPAPKGFENPFSKKDEWPEMGNITSVKEARNGRIMEIRSGSIQYSPIDGGKAYAIVGGDGDGMQLLGDNLQCLVMSNK
jgi:hypothetical protein